jgi:hypothetical protein
MLLLANNLLINPFKNCSAEHKIQLLSKQPGVLTGVKLGVLTLDFVIFNVLSSPHSVTIESINPLISIFS